MKKGVLIGIVCAGVVVLGAAGTVGGIFIPKIVKYNKAEETLNSMAYNFGASGYQQSIEDAKKSFIELETFKESEAKAKECDYCLAGYSLETDNYDEARSIYASLNGYKDSDDKIKEADFCEAEDILNAGNYEDAKQRFTELEFFMDAHKKVLECDYRKAKEFLDNKNYDEAKKIFETLDFEDSDTLAKECDYQSAILLTEDGNYDAARSIFEGLGDYSDSVTYVGVCDFFKAFDYLGEHQINTAGEIFCRLVKDEDVMSIIFNAKNERKDTERFDFKANAFVKCYKEIEYAHMDEKEGTYDYSDYPFVELYYNEGSDDFFEFAVVDVYHKIESYDNEYSNVQYTFDKDGKQVSLW